MDNNIRHMSDDELIQERQSVMNAVGIYFNKTVLKALDAVPKNGNAIQANIRKDRGTMLATGVLRPTINDLLQNGLIAEPARGMYVIIQEGMEWLQNVQAQETGKV